jgi:hypothetical protein
MMRMKKCYPVLFIVLFFLLAGSVSAQDMQQPVRFAAGNFITGNTVSKQGFSKNDLAASLYADKYFVLVQFSVLPSLSIQQQLKNAGIILGSYLPGNAYLATIKNNVDLSVAAKFSIVSINTIPSFYKKDKALYTFNPLNDHKNDKVFAVNFYPAIDKQIVQQQLLQLGAVILPSKFTMSNVIFIEPDKSKIDALAALPFVSYIGLQSVKDRELNYNSIATHAVSGLQSASGRNLNGKGIAVGVGDNSEITNAHVDFSGRVISRVPYPISFHGIHVSGTVAGGGILNPMHHGMAPRATLVSQWFSDIITNTPVYVGDYNMTATCNSYTAADENCTGNGVYDALSNYADAQMRDYETVLHVFAAGNDGDSSCGIYPTSYGTIKTGWQCAKNVLTVGAMDQSDNTIAFFSSRGPVNDGRIKPEIIACGYNTFSTRQNNTYGFNSGTSMAAPVITGVSALLNERYRQLFGATPKAALLKALVCNTAEDMGNAGPDYTWGFGKLNARRAVEAMENNQFFISSTPTSYPLVVPAGVRQLKVMLYWADPAAAAMAGATLINDLDLTVTDPVNGPQLPLILNPIPAKVDSTAKQGADHINNIEQVVIDDPGAGNYSLNVSAFAVPQGPQEYILTYQMDMNGVTVEYPFGGETWVPGEVETIRWSAYGDEAKTFTIEYSDNNGSSWNLIDNNVPAATRLYNWTVPATATNNALIRISRNLSSYTDQSDYTFAILGQPVLTSSIPCEGYVQLNWGAITGADSYDVMQLKGDTMTVIANTVSTSFLVEGLNGATQYWFGVRAKNTTVAGRRSVAVTVTPTTGTCSLAAYTNNMKAVAIIAPVTGRQFTSSALTASEQIKLTVKNLDDVATSGSYDLSYQVNGGSILTETSSAVIAALGTTTYSFTPTAAFSTPGVYDIKAWVKRVGDNRVYDDTTIITIKNLANPAVTLPLTDGFEMTTDKNYIANTIGLDGDDRTDFKTNAIRGRARTFINSGFSFNGSKAITLDQFPVNAALVTDSLLMTYNAAAYNGNQLRYDFYYNNHGQANNPNNKVWIRGSDTAPWVLAYDLVANQGALGEWKHGYINVNDVLDTVLPVQPIGTSFQIKFGEQGNTSANDPKPLLDQDDGYTFDDVTLTQPVNDIAITQVISPAASGCGVAGSQSVAVKIKNYTGTTFTNVPVTYVLNGGSPVTQIMASVVPGEQIFTFTPPVGFLTNTDYDLDLWLYEATDTYRSNDSILNYTFHTSPVINTYPYLEGFEANDGNWYAKGSNSSWQWGTPSKATINKAANGTKAWVTGLATNYKNNELSYLYSPCFDLTSLTQPVLSFSHIFEIEDATPADYNWIEYSTNGGVTWNKLGTFGSGTNWYNDPTGASQWRTSLTTWHVASIDLPVKSATMRFRIAMSSDQGANYDGVGVDDIHIFDKAAIYNSTPLLNTIQNVSGSNWVHFNDGTGKRIASINANGQNLGNTTVDVYPYTGTVRTSSSQYYLNRNIVVKPTIPPVSDVTVRFYFTDAEAKSLLAATGCGSCSKPKDPYELGVTKYSGTTGEENGTLADNLTGIYSYILPANTEIIPYDNGYYAEFSVNSFSEFWLNNGGINADVALPVNLLSFEAAKQNKKSLLHWSTGSEINTNRFNIERSADGRSFTAIGTVAATNQSIRADYNFTDAQPFSGLNYYRLKIIDNAGTFSYSPVRKLNFSGDGIDITVYPNPVNNGTVTISASDNCNKAILYDAAGKQVKAFVLQGRTNSLNVADVAKGIYQLKIFAENGMQTEKIVLQ